MRNVSDGSHLCARQIFVIIPESREGEETTIATGRDVGREAGRVGDERRKGKIGSRRGEEAIDIDFVPLVPSG